MTDTAIPRVYDDEGTCAAKGCTTLVRVAIEANGGLAIADPTGYTGITADGDELVCPEHWCATCGQHHATALDFENCQFYGVREPNMVPFENCAAWAIAALHGDVAE